ncbi:MAG TPA: STAS domain-containing protein [Actinoplanes sp.]
MKLTEAAPPPPLAIDVATVDPVTVTVAVTGEIDMLTAEQLRGALTEAMETRLPRCLVMDMAGVTFVDAAGMSALIHAYHHAARLGVGLLLINVRRLVFRSLRIADLVDLLHVTPHP